jgi:hypothetical protein
MDKGGYAHEISSAKYTSTALPIVMNPFKSAQMAIIQTEKNQRSGGGMVPITVYRNVSVIRESEHDGYRSLVCGYSLCKSLRRIFFLRSKTRIPIEESSVASSLATFNRPFTLTLSRAKDSCVPPKMLSVGQSFMVYSGVWTYALMRSLKGIRRAERLRAEIVG